MATLLAVLPDFVFGGSADRSPHTAQPGTRPGTTMLPQSTTHPIDSAHCLNVVEALEPSHETARSWAHLDGKPGNQFNLVPLSTSSGQAPAPRVSAPVRPGRCGSRGGSFRRPL